MFVGVLRFLLRVSSGPVVVVFVRFVRFLLGRWFLPDFGFGLDELFYFSSHRSRVASDFPLLKEK